MRNVSEFYGEGRPYFRLGLIMTLNRLLPDPKIGIADSNQVGAINLNGFTIYALLRQKSAPKGIIKDSRL